MNHIKINNFGNSAVLNPYGIIPKGNNFIGLLEQAHDRNRFDA